MKTELPPKSEFVWFDVPVGRSLKSTKLEALETHLKQVTSKCTTNRTACMTILPFRKDRQHCFPHNRWKRVLATWQPHTTTVCTCMILPVTSSPKHHKFRLFGTNCILRSRDCDKIVPAEEVVNPLSKDERKEFLRRLFITNVIKFGGPVPSSEIDGEFAFKMKPVNIPVT